MRLAGGFRLIRARLPVPFRACTAGSGLRSDRAARRPAGDAQGAAVDAVTADAAEFVKLAGIVNATLVMWRISSSEAPSVDPKNIAKK